ncbi:MAG: hypothetical protein U9O87_03200 [Verrucomicrobiota bacterium]|nr:hypothetical protein [Verrucomicrobiota bacterium]
MATELPPRPKNKLERIMCDSDLDYLGRIDFIPVSNTLYEELKAQNKMGDINFWNKIQVKFLSSHQYFTSTANNLRIVNKEKQIERIKDTINWESSEEKNTFEKEIIEIHKKAEKNKKDILQDNES